MEGYIFTLFRINNKTQNMAKVGNSSLYDFYFNASPDTIAKAKMLRKEMTPAEKKLWSLLRNKKFDGLKFRRQHPIERFIVDFYCHEKKLAIEVGGLIHEIEINKERDENRTVELEKFDIRVLRFTNEEIINNISEVLEKIHSCLTMLNSPRR